MKTVLLILAGILLLVNPVFAHMEEGSVEDMMSSMMGDQNISDVKQLECNKVSDSEFEELGNAVMNKMVGNSELHEQMDNMMGGEGSASLAQMHIIMGKNWMDCGTGFQGMMGSNMMPSMMRMMGGYYPAYYTSYNVVLVLAIAGWTLLILLIVMKLVLTSTGKMKIVWVQKRRKNS